MSQTSVDSLFQVVGPFADRTPGPTRRDDSQPVFGDHLSQASTGVRDEPPKPQPASITNGHAEPRNQRFDESAANDDYPRPPDSRPSSSDTLSEPADSADGEKHGENARHAHPVVAEGAAEVTPTTDDLSKAAAVAIVVNAALPDAANDALPSVQATPAQQTGATPADARLPIEARTSARPVKKFAAAQDIADNAADQNSAAAPLSSEAEERASSSPKANAPTQPAADTESQPASTPQRNGKRDARDVKPSATVAERSQTQVAVDANQVSDAKSGTETSEKILAEDNGVIADDSRPASNGRTSPRAAARAEAAATAATSAIVAAADGRTATQPSDSAVDLESVEEAAQGPVKPIGVKSDAIAASLSRFQTGSDPLHRNAQTAAAGDVPHVDASRFVGRVAKAFQTAHDRGGALQLRLSPPELGSLRLELTVSEGVLTAAVETETASARRVLLDHLPALRDRLAEQNIRVERFDVDVRDEGRGGQPEDRAPQQQRQQQHNQPASRRNITPQPRVVEGVAGEQPTMHARTNNTGINLVA